MGEAKRQYKHAIAKELTKMVEPSKRIYIAVPEMKGDEKEGFYWSAKPLETRDSIPYILEPEWILVSEQLPENNLYVKVSYIIDQKTPALGVGIALYSISYKDWQTVDSGNFQRNYEKALCTTRTIKIAIKNNRL